VHKIYFDNGSTALPKAPGVADAMKNYVDTAGFNVGRGGYQAGIDVAMQVLETREALAAFFAAPSARNVVFSSGLTTAMNVLLQGFLAEGDHVITTSMEHNSVMRPLHALVESRGVQLDIAACDKHGQLDCAAIEALMRPHTRLVVMLHASNVCGTVLPVAQVGALCRERGIRFIVDAAQTAGVLPLDLGAMNIDALAFAGHKALLGPQGIGGFVISDDFAAEVSPLIFGGTGSQTQSFEQPQNLPDKFESGTQNIPGILGLKAAIEYLNARGIDSIYQHEMKLYEHFVAQVSDIEGLDHIAPRSSDKVAVASVNFPERDNAHIAHRLDREYGIMARCGLHCAPAAHKTLGTYPAGTLRFSFGHANTVEEVDHLLDALRQLIETTPLETEGSSHGI